MARHRGPEGSRDELVWLVEAIVPFDGTEAEHRRDALAWLCSGAEVYRRVKPATPPKHLVAYAAVVDPALQRIFLIEHRKAGLWLPTGGHVDPGEHPFEAARRELLEETGETLPALSAQPILITVDETVGDAVGRHTDVSLWYAFIASAGQSFEIDPKEGARGAWFGLDELREVSCGPQIPRFMSKVNPLQSS